MAGQPLNFNTVLGYRNFQVQPFVEVEDIFVSKAVRSLQLKLRECLVIPPVERMQHRYSVCFPDRICSAASAQEAGADDTSLLPVEEPQPKRARLETTTTLDCEQEADHDAQGEAEPDEDTPTVEQLSPSNHSG
jgi:hypothetical protein